MMDVTRTDTARRSRGAPGDEELAAQVGELIRRLARRLRRASSLRLELFGLTDGQARVLRLVARSGSPLRMSEIARRIEVVPRSATTVVGGLETKGLVVREIDPEDRRSILVRLTDPGRHLLTEMGRDRDAAAGALLDRISRADRVRLLELLSPLAAGDDQEAIR
jgi:DNA-binding MarR family transcriptional regulator